MCTVGPHASGLSCGQSQGVYCLLPHLQHRTVGLMGMGPLICPFWACSSAQHLVGPQLIFINKLLDVMNKYK